MESSLTVCRVETVMATICALNYFRLSLLRSLHSSQEWRLWHSLVGIEPLHDTLLEPLHILIIVAYHRVSSICLELGSLKLPVRLSTNLVCFSSSYVIIGEDASLDVLFV